MDSILFSPIPMADLIQEMRKLIREEMKSEKDQVQEKLLSSDEARKVFQPELSLSTLKLWTKNGVLKSHRLGGRNFYRLSEILEASKSLKKYKTVLDEK